MIVTVLWEDQLGGEIRAFGPHTLLLACLVDDGSDGNAVKRLVNSSPKKGNGGVVRALRRDFRKLSNHGPVFAVLDRDKAHEIWRTNPAPNCKQVTIDRLRVDAPGDYQVVLLENNVESLCAAALMAMEKPPFSKKPTPEERDRLLNRLATATIPSQRQEARKKCPSFDRLVRKVASVL